VQCSNNDWQVTCEFQFKFAWASCSVLNKFCAHLSCLKWNNTSSMSKREKTISLCSTVYQQIERISDMWKVNWSTWHGRGTGRKSGFLTGVGPVTSQTLVGRSIDWAVTTHAEQCHSTEFIWGVLHTARISTVKVMIWTQLNDLVLHELSQLSG